MQRARRLDLIPPYLFAEIARKVRAKREAGIDVITLGIADPDQPTPDHIIDAMVRAVRDVGDPDRHRYGGDVPVKEFPQAVADWYQRRFGVTLDPATEVLPLIGSKEGIAHVALAMIDPPHPGAEGDVTLVPQPGYPVYTMGTYFAGGEVHVMPLREANGWLPDFDAIPHDLRRRAKVMWLNYPNNPTGAVATKEFLARAVSFAHEHDLLICHDAAYTELTYDGYVAPSILEIEGARDVCIEFNSLSKPYNMTGWRIAMAVGNREALAALNLVKENSDSGILRAIQWAGVAALTGPQDCVREVCEIYRRRRDLIADSLARVGITFPKPKATLYVWAPVPARFPSSAAFAEHLIEQAAVVVTPGRGYGDAGEGYFRVSLTYPDDRTREAMARIEKALA